MEEIRIIQYEDILPVWKDILWKDRLDAIEPMSAMIFPEGFDGKIFETYRPTFFGCYDGDRLVGVNSGHRTSSWDYRSRGLYVDPDYRRRKLAQRLLEATARQGVKEGAITLWSYPKKSAVHAYIEFGFLESEISPETETHCYVWKRIGP
ncbi:MAG: GNAT family N-acetyltransferase [Bdellovibrionaceae bacterium]|nr:GNAT family N-acetyltransferase [Pseudobdellovibrionaceae bacterium]